MSKKRTSLKISLIVALCLIVVGTIVFCIAFKMIEGDFTKLSTEKFAWKTYTVNEDFSNISIDSKDCDISFAVSDDGMCKVKCYESESLYYTVNVENGVIKITRTDNRKWYTQIGINVNDSNVIIYLPKTEYKELYFNTNSGNIDVPETFSFEKVDIKGDSGDVSLLAKVAMQINVKTNSGDVEIANNTANIINIEAGSDDISVSHINSNGSLFITSSSGDINLSDIKLDNLEIKTDSGKTKMDNIIATNIKGDSKSGEMTLSKCDAKLLNLVSDSGDIEGSLLGDMIYNVKTNSGDIKVPKSVAGGECNIKTDSGDILFE